MDIQESDYNHWKHHPVSKIYRQFLADYRQMLLKEVFAQWEAGAVELTLEKEVRGRIVQLNEILDLEFEHIRNFYAENDTTSEPDSQVLRQGQRVLEG